MSRLVLPAFYWTLVAYLVWMLGARLAVLLPNLIHRIEAALAVIAILFLLSTGVHLTRACWRT